MDESPGSSTRSKRKRESESSSSSRSEADPSFMQRAETAAIPLLDMLKDCQLQLMSDKNTGGTIDCCATYSFSKEIKDIKSQQMNDYGRGQLKVVRIGMDGTDIHPSAEWMENRISLQAFFYKKVATDKPHSSGDPKKRGFEIPWRADIQLGSLPNGCAVESVQLSFICPTGQGSPTVAIHPDHGANLYYINDEMRNMTGQTYSECCQELGIFRQATVYVKMRVPFRLLMREQLGQLREGIPIRYPNIDADDLIGLDNVTLNSGGFSIQVFREILCEMSAKAEEIFTEKSSGKVTVYETKYGKDAVPAVIYASVLNFGDFLLDPLEAQTSVLFDVMCLSLDWDVEPLKWVAQFALLERLCTPGFNVGTVPLAMHRIWNSYAGNAVLSDIAKLLLAGFVIVLQSMKGDALEGTLPHGGMRNSWLWDKIKEFVEPVAVKMEVEDIPAAANALPLPGERTDIRVVLLDGTQEVHYRLKPSCPIGKLKASIHQSFDLPSEGFRLIYEGPRGYEILRGGTIADYGLENGDEVRVHPELVGC